MAVLADNRGIVTVADEYLSMLKSAGLDSFSALTDCGRGAVLKEKKNRRIIRIAIPGSPALTLYMKEHRRTPLLEAIASLLSGTWPASPARREWRVIKALRAAGIETMAPVAYGERGSGTWRGPSFLLTAEAEGKRLEDHVPLLKGKFREKRCIIAALADCARRMHRQGFNHRDFYLCHLFLAGDLAKTRIILIDLQRVQRRARGFNRWVVKDLAALNYSSPRGVVSAADRMRFIRAYLAADKLGKREKSLWRRIERKTDRIRRHDARRLGRPGE